MTPEQKARVSIDALLVQAGWHVCNVTDASIHAATGVAIREFPLNNGFGFADYLLYVNGKACGVIEAKIQAVTLTEVELHSSRYAQGLPTSLPAWRRPLPFVWESTGVETHFTNGLDPEPRARAVFAFFRPELLVQWLAYLPSQVALVTEIDRQLSILREDEVEVDTNLKRAQALRQATLAKAFAAPTQQ